MSTVDIKDAAGTTKTVAVADTTGQKAMTDSIPVAIASDQTQIPVGDTRHETHAPAYYQVTVTTTAQSLATLIATTVPTWATMAFITPETGAIRYRGDGTAPTSSVGQPIASGQSWPVSGPTALAGAQLIASASTTVSIEFRG